MAPGGQPHAIVITGSLQQPELRQLCDQPVRGRKWQVGAVANLREGQPQVPVVELSWAPMIGLTVVAVAFMAAGIVGFTRRDVS